MNWSVRRVCILGLCAVRSIADRLQPDGNQGLDQLRLSFDLKQTVLNIRSRLIAATLASCSDLYDISRDRLLVKWI